MSISKCPVCQSTDINSVTCNNCGAMLLFMGDDGAKNGGSPSVRKEPRSTESIINEILEASNVKSSPFEKIEYVEDEPETADNDATNVVTEMSFSDLARERGYNKEDSSTQNTEETDEAVCETNDDIQENEISEDIDADKTDSVTSEETAIEYTPVQCENDDNPADVKASPVDEVSEDNTDKAEKDSYEEMVSLVERISQKVNEKIEKEEQTEQKDNVQHTENKEPAISKPKQPEKMVVKEKIKKEIPEESVKHVEMNINTKGNKTLNICRFSLMLLMLVTVVCMFLPSTRIGGFSSGQSVQIFAVISVIPFAVGFVLCLKEKTYIRKFIYSLCLSLVFGLAYAVFMLSFSGGGLKGMVYLLLCAMIAIVSLTGIRCDKSPSVRKANTWFDAFAYILLFVNISVVLFVALFTILVPDMLGTAIGIYLLEVCAVVITGAVSAVLMIKRKSFGTDLLMISALAFIVLNLISYNKIMAAVSFDYTVNIPYMHYMGFVVSGFNIFCSAFAAGMFFWMKHLGRITPANKAE